MEFAHIPLNEQDIVCQVFFSTVILDRTLKRSAKFKLQGTKLSITKTIDSLFPFLNASIAHMNMGIFLNMHACFVSLGFLLI